MATSKAKPNTSPRLTIKLFGRFEILRDGVLIPETAWRLKAKTLLKYLLTKPGHVFSQDQLIEVLFGGENPKSAIGNMYARVSELRRTLEADLPRGVKSQFVVRQGAGYYFNIAASVWIDTIEFSKHLDEGEAYRKGGQHAGAVAALEAAIGLYRGDFLEADRYEEWSLSPREHWQEQYFVVLTHLAEEYAHLGDFHRAAITCRQAFDRQPSREDILRQLMRCYHAAGERAEALRVYQIGIDTLQTDLHVAPSVETETLHDEIFRGIPDASKRVPDKTRIVVLPLVNIGASSEDEYFADGMTEELIHTLAQIRDLKVIAQTSALSYKNTQKTIAQIGRELNIGTALEGSVRKADDIIRITVQLVDVESEEHLWSEEYDRPLKDIFAIQSDVAQQVARALRIGLSSGVVRLAEDSPWNLEVYTAYLEGRHFLYQDGGLDQAIQSYKHALAVDPTYAVALAALAEAYCLRGIWRGDLGAFAEAEDAARKAIALSDSLPEAYIALGLVAWLKERDPELAESYFKEAIALNQSCAEAHHWYGQLLEQLERPSEGLVEVLRAHELDPLSTRFNFTLGFMLIMERRFDEAVNRFEKALRIDPSFLSARIWLGRARQVAWDWKGSEKAYREAVTADPENPEGHQWLSIILQSVGKTDEAMMEMERALELAEEPYPRSFSYNQGTGYYFLGKYDLALRYLKNTGEGFTQPLWGLAWIYNEIGEYDKALETLGKAEEALSGSFFYPRSFHSVWIACNRGVAYARMGEEEKARRQLAKLQASTDELCKELCIAVLHFVLGDVDLGFESLEKSVEKHNGMLMHIKNLPMLDPVRGDPRYMAILQRMGMHP